MNFWIFAEPGRPNAIQIDVVPKSLAVEAGLGDHPNQDRTLGLDLVSPSQMAQVEADLAGN